MPRRHDALRVLGGIALLLGAASAGCLDAAQPTGAAAGAADGSLFSRTTVFPGDYDTTGPYSRPLARGPHGLLDPEVVALASDVDGAPIQLGIVRPDVPAGTRVPVILDASMYYGPMTAERIRENPHNPNINWWSVNAYAYLAEAFVAHGYAVAFLSVRGTGDSGGCFSVFGDPDARRDLDQAITWLGTQAWSNGNVGMFGISGEGVTQWMAAATGNPHLKTIVPVVGGPDFHDVLFRNGTIEDLGLVVLGLGFAGYGLGVDHLSAANDPAQFVHTLPGSRGAERRLEGAACPAHAEAASALAYSAATLRRDDPAGFWEAANNRPGVEAAYRGSVFVVNGLQDPVAMRILYPWVNALEAQGVVVKHLLGQWGHAFPDHRISGEQDANKRWDFSETLLRWYDRWLKEDASVDVGSAVQVQDTLGLWRAESAWPPRDATPRDYPLTAGGGLDPDAAEPASTALICPARADSPTGCEASLRFSTGTLARELRFAGLPTLHLTVTPWGPGGRLEAVLSVVGADGESRLGRGVVDLRVADGTSEPRPVDPGRPLVARRELEPMDVAIRPGDSLVLDLSQGSAEGAGLSAAVAPVGVSLGGDASVLTLRVFARGPDAFFVPPGVDA